jgi:ribonucleotide reductase beta subunit family protein with ferritin-like domain
MWQNDSPALSSPDKARHISYPIENKPIVDLYNTQEKIRWTEKEIEFHDDIMQMKRPLVPNVEHDRTIRYMLRYITAFFLFIDGLIGLSVGNYLPQKITIREILDFMALQSYIETVHNKTYSKMFDSLFPGEVTRMAKEILTYPAIQAKITWVNKWIKNIGASTQQLVVANAIIESIFLTPSFGFIEYLKKKNKLPGVCASNMLISRDENIHRNHWIEVYKMVESEYRLPQSVIHEMIYDATEAEKEFAREGMIENDLPDFTLRDIKQYAEYIADLLAVDLGYDRVYDVRNPFPWIVAKSLESIGNYFEVQVTEYTVPVGMRTPHAKPTDGADYSDDPNF